MWIICGRAFTGGNPSTRRKPPSSVTLSTTNSKKQTRLGQNRGLCGVELATNRLSRGKIKTIEVLMMMMTITVYFTTPQQIYSNSCVMISYRKIMSSELPVNLQLRTLDKFGPNYVPPMANEFHTYTLHIFGDPYRTRCVCKNSLPTHTLLFDVLLCKSGIKKLHGSYSVVLVQAVTARPHRWRLIDSATRYTSWGVRLSPIEALCALFITQIRLANCFHRRRPIFYCKNNTIRTHLASAPC